MAHADTSNLLTTIDSADPNGHIQLFVPLDQPLRTKEHAREWLLTVFPQNSLVTLKLDVVKKSISEIDLEISADTRHNLLIVNLAKLLQLPAANPEQELADFRALCVVIREFYAAHPTVRANVQLFNNRDNRGRVYGSIECRIPQVDNEHYTSVDEAFTAKVNTCIKRSAALEQWLRQVALTLQRIGPWSGSCIREDDVFGYFMGPYSQHITALFEAKGRNVLPAEAPLADTTRVTLDI